MFRESDVTAKNPHKIVQQVPTLQAVSRASRFDEGSTTVGSSRNLYPPEPVPTTWDTRIDPTHRDADWAGLVPKGNHRRHVNEHRAQVTGLMQTEQGIVSVSEKEEWLRKRRDNTASTDTSLIGGNGASGDDHWKTSIQRMNLQEPTAKDQLTLDKRVLPRRSQATISQSSTSRMPFNSNPITPIEQSYQITRSSRDMAIGSNRCIGRNGSMLTNIGQALASNLPIEDHDSMNRGI